MPLNIPADVGALTLIEDFITEHEERTLVDDIVRNLPDGESRKKALTRNVVQRWGSPVPYTTHILSAVIPEHFQFLLDRIMEQHVLAVRPDSITMNQYLAQQAILAHIDDPRGGNEITILSLLTPARLVFRKQGRVFTVDLPPRSLVQMSDEIRYNWTHEIEPVAATRYSLVFRCSHDITTV